MKIVKSPNTSLISTQTSKTTLFVRDKFKMGPQHVLAIVFLVLLVASIIFVPGFSQISNLSSVLSKSAYIGVVACGMTLLISTGSFDLSVAGIVSTSAIVLVMSTAFTSLFVGIILAILSGALMGLINGLVVTKLRINAFITTFGMMNVFLATSFIISGDNVHGITDARLLTLGIQKIFNIPISFLILVAVLLGFYILMHQTELGRQFKALGSSSTAARVAGLPVDRIKIVSFMISGIACGIAAVLLASRLSSASATMATGIELEAITIAVLGGTSLKGGNATFFGTLIATLLITVIQNILNLLQITSYWQHIATGAVLVFALVLVARRSNIADWR